MKKHFNKNLIISEEEEQFQSSNLYHVLDIWKALILNKNLVFIKSMQFMNCLKN